MNEPESKIGELIQEAGCTCEKPPECLADHTCLAGMAEMEWQSLDAERQYLRIRCLELTFDRRSEYEVIQLRERIAELKAANHKLKDEIEAYNCGIGRKLYISAGNVPDDNPDTLGQTPQRIDE